MVARASTLKNLLTWTSQALLSWSTCSEGTGLVRHPTAVTGTGLLGYTQSTVPLTMAGPVVGTLKVSNTPRILCALEVWYVH